MRDAVIGSTAQIPIGKAYRGALSDISGPSSPRTPSPPPSAGQGSQARRSTTSPWAAPCRKARPALRGLAGRAPRRTVRRRAGRDRRPACGPGPMAIAIAIAAKQIIADGMTVTVGGGVESISLVQNAQEHLPRAGPVAGRPWAIDLHPDARHRGERRRTPARSYSDLRTPICFMNWGNAAQETVAFWLNEPPGRKRSTTRSTRLWSSGYTCGQV
jgi:hypothetical protein